VIYALILVQPVIILQQIVFLVPELIEGIFLNVYARQLTMMIILHKIASNVKYNIVMNVTQIILPSVSNLAKDIMEYLLHNNAQEVVSHVVILILVISAFLVLLKDL